MSGFLGQIPEDVEGLALDFDAKASDVETVIQSINSKLAVTTWEGADRDSFEAAWNGEISAMLNGLAQSLRDTGVIANNNAQQQRTASS
jgi:hypothetical protein